MNFFFLSSHKEHSMEFFPGGLMHFFSSKCKFNIRGKQCGAGELANKQMRTMDTQDRVWVGVYSSSSTVHTLYFHGQMFSS